MNEALHGQGEPANDNRVYDGFQGHSYQELLKIGAKCNHPLDAAHLLRADPCYGRGQDNFAWYILFQSSWEAEEVNRKRSEIKSIDGGINE